MANQNLVFRSDWFDVCVVRCLRTDCLKQYGDITFEIIVQGVTYILGVFKLFVGEKTSRTD